MLCVDQKPARSHRVDQTRVSSHVLYRALASNFAIGIGDYTLAVAYRRLGPDIPTRGVGVGGLRGGRRDQSSNVLRTEVEVNARPNP
jgi:hypothetical protein